MLDQERKLTAGTKLGYGAASMGDALMYSVVVVFLIYYLTAIVGIDPGIAGSISSLALFASAVSTLFLGYFSDNSRSKAGRRRPFIKIALPLIFISFIAMFSSFGLTGIGAILYYGFFAILFWISYCMFFVPYTALGAEITNDYSQRISIRSYAAAFTQAGNFSATVFPMILVTFFMGQGKSESVSWTISAAIFILVSVICISVMLHCTKGRELVIEQKADAKKPNLLKDYFEAIKAKPTKYLLLSIIGFLLVNSIFSSNLTFFVIYNLKLPESSVSTVFVIMFLVAIPLAPVINFIAQKIDKRRTFILLFCLGAGLLVLFQVIGINSWIMLALSAVAFVIANAGYWQLMSATLYDVAEVIELKTGRRFEGTLSSLQSIAQQVGAAIAMLVLGWVLEINGFSDALTTQTPQALTAIELLQTVVPAVGLLFSAAMMALFPINKRKYELLQEALKQQKATGSYEAKGLEKII